MEWLIDEVEKIGKTILNLRGRGIRTKKDGSPVTDADIVADKMIRDILKDYPVVSEEGGGVGNEEYYLVDPLDGTKSFIMGRPYFTINIAFMNPDPYFGIIHAPALDLTYYSDGKKSFVIKEGEKKRISVGRNNPIIQVSSLSHITEKEIELSKLTGSKLIRIGSSIKGCFVAEGKADFYPRFGKLRDWDIGAMHAILKNSGGRITDLEGNPIKYGTNNRTIRGFLASNSFIHDQILEIIRGNL